MVLFFLSLTAFVLALAGFAFELHGYRIAKKNNQKVKKHLGITNGN